MNQNKINEKEFIEAIERSIGSKECSNDCSSDINTAIDYIYERLRHHSEISKSYTVSIDVTEKEIRNIFSFEYIYDTYVARIKKCEFNRRDRYTVLNTLRQSGFFAEIKKNKKNNSFTLCVYPYTKVSFFKRHPIITRCLWAILAFILFTILTYTLQNIIGVDNSTDTYTYMR